MKNLKKVLALVLAVVMIMGVVSVASAKTYKDADAEAFKNYADAIDALSSLNILDGFEDGEFKADRTFNRAQAAKIVAIVHNAATNGKIKGQDAISALYSNAQNPFVDCNTSWALPYINYCRITGLADGMTATTYAPKRELTGVQWLKLMLTTLNFDTAKEGYTGTGWDVNVLNRANEVGLTAGLADDWKAIAPIKRGEAAQILYNALTKYLVEYGQKVKNNYVDDKTLGKYYNYSFISNEQVAKSGYTLGGKMGISIKRATDDFRRPGYAWSYGSWAAFYMDKPVNTYTTAVTACDILKNDMKVSETSGKSVKLNGHVKGEVKAGESGWENTYATELKVDGKATKGTALNYFAVDGRKYAYGAEDYAGITLSHDQDKNCQKVTGGWWNAQFGGQGDLTQVFKTEDGWVITTIHTFLAEVTKVNKTNKYNHINGETSDLKVWVDMQDNGPVYAEKHFVAKNGIATTDYAVGTKVLVTLSLKKSETENLVDHEREGVVASIAAADSKTGKLTGASDLAYAESVSVDGTKYPTACRFVMGKNDAMKFANYGKTFTFYFDSYGNVIGRDDNTTASTYVVMDKIYAYSDKGVFTIKADLYDLEGKKLEDVTVAQAGDFADFKPNTNEAAKAGAYEVSIYAAMNKTNLVDALYTYTVNDKGAYVLNWTGSTTNNNPYGPTATDPNFAEGYGRLDGSYTHTAKLAYIYAGGNTTTAEVKLSESTKFIVKSIGGEWTSYTGYTALPALTAKYMDVVHIDGDGYADVVYLGNAIFAGDSITGWVVNWGRFNWADGYDLVTVYVAGEPVVVNVPNPLGTTDSSTLPLGAGMYTFEIGKDKNGVAYATAYKRTADISGFVALGTVSKDTTAITLQGGEVIGLTDVAIYAVNADGTVTKADASVLTDGDYVEYFKEGSRGSAPYAELYVIDKNLYSSLYT
jgi:hypothetical protein